jgi:uncharacterized membrane protein (DUF4010 family)
MEFTHLFIRFGSAMGIGFLIGLQREYAFRDSKRELVAGERTFALMGLVGALAAFSAEVLNYPAAFVGIIMLVGLVVAVSYFTGAQRGFMGLTTEITILIVVILGALCYWGHLTLAVALGIATAVLLSLKLETDRLVQALTREDIVSALKLAVISAIILPILPNQPLGPPPFDVFNPFKIWLFVVFISAINFVGYVLIKIIGPEQGISLTGLLGGMVSSTSTTLILSERSRRDTGLARSLSLAIIISWAVMFARLIIYVGILSPPLLAEIWLPLAVAGSLGLGYAGYTWFRSRSQDPSTQEKEGMEFSNPLNLWTAIQFGVIYAVILVVARSAQIYFGDTGILVSSFIAGFANVDAITLSLTELTKNNEVSLNIAGLSVVLAAMSNTAVKGAIVLISGHPTLRKTILPGFLIILASGILVAALTFA